MTYTGGCSCGSVRFAFDDYLYVLACHCQACKKRTGSAFGTSVVVENAKVTNLEGETKTFTRKAELLQTERYLRAELSMRLRS